MAHVPPNKVSLTLQEGYIQECQGYLERKSRILKRWKKRWISVEPGEFYSIITGEEIPLLPKDNKNKIQFTNIYIRPRTQGYPCYRQGSVQNKTKYFFICI